MSRHYRVDPEAFQTVLANAFAVQESGLCPESLSALIEIQRFLASREADLNQAMQMIAERVLGVSQASGVAIGLFEAKRNELVYRAGSGSASGDVGRHVSAVLSVSPAQDMRREILRVEDAETDKRLEAEICRQFGAKSLLILPICNVHTLIGVMQVLFDKAHSFSDGEVRAYRLMIGALEEGMLRQTQVTRPEARGFQHAVPALVQSHEHHHTVGAALVSRIPDMGGKQNAAQELPGSDDELSAISATVLSQEYDAMLAREVGSWLRTLGAQVHSIVTRPWSTELRSAGIAIGVAVVLTVTVWISHRNQLSTKEALSISTLRAAQAKGADKATLANEEPSGLENQSNEALARSRGFKRVRVGPHEVDYISDDVTIRKFETRPAQAQIRTNPNEVHFGQDVTVRYFLRDAAFAEAPSASDAAPSTNQHTSRSR